MKCHANAMYLKVSCFCFVGVGPNLSSSTTTAFFCIKCNISKNVMLHFTLTSSSTCIKKPKFSVLFWYTTFVSYTQTSNRHKYSVLFWAVCHPKKNPKISLNRSSRVFGPLINPAVKHAIAGRLKQATCTLLLMSEKKWSVSFFRKFRRLCCGVLTEFFIKIQNL